MRLGYLTQEPVPVDPDLRVLEAAEQIRGSAVIGKREMSASQLLERLGLRGDRQWTRVGELSGGERRRLQLLLMLLAEPNVLLLDEPTNDLDIETLTELEDLLDGWPGSVVVVSHDRYFLERVTDHVRRARRRASLLSCRAAWMNTCVGGSSRGTTAGRWVRAALRAWLTGKLRLACLPGVSCLPRVTCLSGVTLARRPRRGRLLRASPVRPPPSSAPGRRN